MALEVLAQLELEQARAGLLIFSWALFYCELAT